MKKRLFLLAVVSFLSFNIDLKAQPPDPGGGGDLPSCFPPPCVPIDGGLSWLLVAGAAYGGKKYFDIQKKEEEK